MQIIIVLTLIVLIIVIINNNSKNRHFLELLIDSVGILQKEIRDLKKGIQPLSIEDEARWAPKPVTPAPPIGRPQAPKDPVPDIIPRHQPPPPVNQEQPRPAMQEKIAPVERAITPLPPPAVKEPEESWSDKWLRNNSDLEKFIGENLINKIGIAVLVLGIAFFVKYAIDQNWINEVGRVCIGLGCGGLLIGLAHYLRNSYRSFSSVLAGGGIAVFYFTIAFAFHQYQLLSQTAAFVIMLVITIFAVILALLYDKLELAVIAIIGGFVTPFLVSTGSGNYLVLFTYLSILNAGLLSLAYFKRWPLVNILALFFTVAIYSTWLTKSLLPTPVTISLPNALLFASVFYLLFLGTNMINQVRNRQPFKGFDFSILLFINACYFSAGICITHNWNDGAYQGVFTLLMGLINLTMAYLFFRQKSADKNLLYLLIGLTLTFISLAIPVQLHGHTITLFWSAEFVLLYWLFQRSGIPLFRLSSFIVCILTGISLLMDWSIAATNSPSHLLVMYTGVTGFATNIFVAVCFACYAWLLKKEDSNVNFMGVLSNRSMSRVSMVIVALLLYLTAIYGVNLLSGNMTTYEVANVYHRLITETVVVAGFAWLHRMQGKNARWLQLVAVMLCFLFYLVSSVYAGSLRDLTLTNHRSMVHFIFHWVDVLLLSYLLYLGTRLIRNNKDVFASALHTLTWVTSVAAVILLSVEALHVFVIAGYKPGIHISVLVRQYSKAGLTILWALCSFSLMWLGMRYKFKHLRIISLSLFSLVLFKLFIMDIRGISEGGKIAAFVLLGVLLLTVSFMYQKLKKLVTDDKQQ
jgi:uncharacterized membrane protein